MVVPIAGSLAALIVAYLVAIPAIRYRITDRNLVISLLGIPLRWVSLKNIRYVSDHSRVASEPWPSTHNPLGRHLFIRKRHGLFGSLMITPEKRFVFKADLERAIRALDPNVSFDETAFYERSKKSERAHHTG